MITIAKLFVCRKKLKKNFCSKINLCGTWDNSLVTANRFISLNVASVILVDIDAFCRLRQYIFSIETFGYFVENEEIGPVFQNIKDAHAEIPQSSLFYPKLQIVLSKVSFSIFST